MVDDNVVMVVIIDVFFCLCICFCFMLNVIFFVVLLFIVGLVEGVEDIDGFVGGGGIVVLGVLVGVN